MVELNISSGTLELHVRGADKLWALKSWLSIPLHHISAIRADPTIARGWWHRLKRDVFGHTVKDVMRLNNNQGCVGPPIQCQFGS